MCGMSLVSGRSANRLHRAVVQIGEHLHLSELFVDVSYILGKLDHKSAGSIFLAYFSRSQMRRLDERLVESSIVDRIHSSTMHNALPAPLHTAEAEGNGLN